MADTSLYLDNTLTPGGDPALLSDHISEHLSVQDEAVENVTPTNSPPPKTPRSGDAVQNGGDVLESGNSARLVDLGPQITTTHNIENM